MITVFESSKTLFGALLHRFQFALSVIEKKTVLEIDFIRFWLLT
jgi:hypothetical protein